MRCYDRHTRSLNVLLFALCLLVAPSTHAQSQTVDLTAAFRAAGIEIDRLVVYKISDVVLIRGRTSDRAMVAEAMRLARSLGHVRVANLIELVPALDDDQIVRLAARKLDMARPLEGCTFRVSSRKGVVRLRAVVRHAVQKDYAVKLVRKIDGVVAVHLD